MREDDDEPVTRPSIMEYNGGLLSGPPGLSPHGPGEDQATDDPDRPEYWIRRGKHPPIVCPEPRIVYDWNQKAKCPYCGMKARLAGDETISEWAYRVTDSFWRTVGAALLFPFRRAEAPEDSEV